MRVPGLVRYFCACVHLCMYVRAPARVCQSKRERDEGGCMYVWVLIYLPTGVGVKADRMRIVIILGPRIYIAY